MVQGMCDLLGSGIEPCLLHWQVDSLPLSHQGSPQALPFASSCAVTPGGSWVMEGVHQVGGLGLGPAAHVARGQVLSAGPLHFLPEVFTGGHTGDLFQTAMNSNLSLTKTVQETFGKRLRAPALFMRTFNGRSCSCSRWMSTGPLLSVPLCFLLSLNKFGGCHVRAWMDGFELQLIKSRHLPEG